MGTVNFTDTRENYILARISAQIRAISTDVLTYL